MPRDLPPIDLTGTQPGWYCVQTQPKREKTASAQLAQLPELNVLLPRLRFEKRAKGKPEVEPMFPSYFFARFNPLEHFRNVSYCRGVRRIVRTGQRLQTVPEAIIAELKASTEHGEFRVPANPLEVGGQATIIDGLFTGMGGEVLQVLPGRERVLVLLDMMGLPREVSLAVAEVEASV